MKRLKKNILLTGSMILLITGCTTNRNAPLKSSPNVAQVKKIRAMEDRNAIALEWDIVNKPNVKGYYIQRISLTNRAKTVKTIENKYITHWTDVNLEPDKKYTYQISAFDENGVPSFAKKIETQTKKTILPVSFFEDAGLKVRGVIKLIFRPHLNERVKGYIIEKFDDVNNKWKEVENITPRLRAEFLDTNLLDGKVYKYRIIAYTFDGLRSEPTMPIEIQTLQRPSVVQNINVTTNLAKKIVLSWSKVPKTNKYKIYMSDSENGDYIPLATTKNDKYIDVINKNGVTRFYKVSSVDIYGIESLQTQSVMGKTINVPVKPIVSNRGEKIVKLTIVSPDQRAVSYNIVKKHGDIVYDKVKGVHSPYIDKEVQSGGNSYSYEIYAVDKNGLESEPAEIEVKF